VTESTKALLQAAREGLSPDAAALARVKAKVSASAAATTMAAAVSTKVVLSLAVAGLVGAAALAVHWRDDRVPVAVPAPAPVSVPVAVSVSVPVPGTPTATVTPAVTAPASVTAAPKAPPKPPVASSPPQAAPHIAVAIARPVEAPVIAVPPPTHASLSREVSLVDSAQAALRASDFRGALSIIHTYDAETALSGQLAEDAAAIEVEALCRLADPAAAAQLADFDTRWPHSAERARLTAACR
jgi:hypothetical protein